MKLNGLLALSGLTVAAVVGALLVVRDPDAAESPDNPRGKRLFASCLFGKYCRRIQARRDATAATYRKAR